MRSARLGSFVVLALPLLGAQGALSQGRTWTMHHNQKFGFSLRVPTDVFVSGKPRKQDDGWLWISRDRQARLLAAAGKNETGETLESYRRFVVEQSYPSVSFDDAPIHDTWFALSGTKGSQRFYEHVAFACQGRYIYGWQLMYPASARHLYGPIVEEIEKSFQPGRGKDGNCG